MRTQSVFLCLLKHSPNYGFFREDSRSRLSLGRKFDQIFGKSKAEIFVKAKLALN